MSHIVSQHPKVQEEPVSFVMVKHVSCCHKQQTWHQGVKQLVFL